MRGNLRVDVSGSYVVLHFGMRVDTLIFRWDVADRLAAELSEAVKGLIGRLTVAGSLQPPRYKEERWGLKVGGKNGLVGIRITPPEPGFVDRITLPYHQALNLAAMLKKASRRALLTDERL